MFSSFNSSSEANQQQQHHQQLPFACTFLQHQEDAQQLDQFRQLQPLSHYDNQQTLTDVVISRKSSVTRSLPTLKHRHVRKDRHSKVNTTQGLRNRRIRLSIGIARRFFDLQEMLGFDKPSKTLEWLLGSSTKAIKKLGKIDSSSSHSTASLTSSSPCSNCTAGVGAKAKKMKKAGNELDALARESRAKARARARERTLEKLTSRANCIQLMKVKDDSSPHFSASNLNFSLEDQGCNNLSNKVLIADSNKTISTSIHRQQNLVIAREDCYLNNLDYYLPTLPSSWDFESVINAYLCTEASIHGKGMGIHNK